MEMTIDWIDEILFPERDDKGRPAFLAKLSSMQAPVQMGRFDQAAVIRQKMWAHGIPQHEIEKTVSQLKEQQKQLHQLMYARPKPPTREEAEEMERAKQKRIEEYLAKQ